MSSALTLHNYLRLRKSPNFVIGSLKKKPKNNCSNQKIISKFEHKPNELDFVITKNKNKC